MEIIPSIDIKDGKCVRLYQGDFAQMTVYSDDPVEVARRWAAAGARRLHIVDLDGSRAGHPVNNNTITAIVKAVNIPVQLGGGLRTELAVDSAFRLGIARVILGTAAVQDPDLIARLVERYGDAIIAGIDARNGIVATTGWTTATEAHADALAEQMASLGVRRIVYTDIGRDGTLTEPNYSATAALVRPGGPAIIASGGVGRIEHLRQLARTGVEGTIIGRALYTGDIQLAEALATIDSDGDEH